MNLGQFGMASADFHGLSFQATVDVVSIGKRDAPLSAIVNVKADIYVLGSGNASTVSSATSIGALIWLIILCFVMLQ